MLIDLISTKNLPTLDLHGETSDISKIKLKDFIKENIGLKSKYFLVIHGVGQDILRKSVHEVLKENKMIEQYKVQMYNSGCTIVKLKHQ